jgi:hypothetical protein
VSRGATWVPNQHGAWAMLATPLLVGVLAGGASWTQLPLALVGFCGYFAFFAAGLWLKSRRKPRFRAPVVVYSAACVPLAAVVLALQPSLLRWAPAFAPFLVVGLVEAVRRRDRSLLSGAATTLAASLMTVVAYDAGPGEDWTRAWLLTAVVAGYHLGVLVHVKALIRERRNPAYARAAVALHVLLTLLAALVSWPLVLVGVVLVARTVLAQRLAPSPKRVGIAELVVNVLVVVVALGSVGT